MDGNHVPHHLGEFPADAVLLGRHVCVVEFDEALVELGGMTKVLDRLCVFMFFDPGGRPFGLPD
jgi:hypothetical protein